MDPMLDFDPKDLIKSHMECVFTSWSQRPGAKWARKTVDKSLNENLEFISNFAIGCMQEALNDGERHSSGISEEDIHIVLSAFPCSIEEAKRQYYFKGYYEYLNSALRLARSQNPGCHFIHFQFFWDEPYFLVQFTLFPNRDELSFEPLYHLPLDVLTESDLQILKDHGIEFK